MGCCFPQIYGVWFVQHGTSNPASSSSTATIGGCGFPRKLDCLIESLWRRKKDVDRLSGGFVFQESRSFVPRSENSKPFSYGTRTRVVFAVSSTRGVARVGAERGIVARV